MPDSLNEKKFASQFTKIAGILGVFTSLMLLPDIFEYTLAVDDLLPVERTNLWIFSTILFIFSVWFVIFSKKNKINFALFFFVLIVLIGTELTTRVFVNLFASKQTNQELANYVNRTYPEFLAYRGHPFTSYMGKSSKALVGTEITGGFKPFNNFGFVGDDFIYQKNEGTIRIAALGASTTARGYPALMEKILNETVGSACQFEVMNFGVTGWTSAHTMVNFMLNVVDFNPDYVIIHHAWNENKVRNYPDNVFKGDYSHAFTYFHEPEIADKIPLRISVIYRLLKIKFSVLSMPSWMFVGKATNIINNKPVSPAFENLDELNPFERNIKQIIDIAIRNGIRVILTTQPHSSDSSISHFSASKGIDQVNDISRIIRSQYEDKTLFVELDTLMTGKENDLFVDVGHLNEEGKYLKAKYIAEHIIADSVWFKTVCDPSGMDPIFSGLTTNEILLMKYYKNKLIKKQPKEMIQGAVENGINVNDMLLENALVQYNLLTENDKNRIFQIVSNIESNAKWYQGTVKQANIRSISINEMIIISAMAIFNKERRETVN